MHINVANIVLGLVYAFSSVVYAAPTIGNSMQILDHFPAPSPYPLKITIKVNPPHGRPFAPQESMPYVPPKDFSCRLHEIIQSLMRTWTKNAKQEVQLHYQNAFLDVKPSGTDEIQVAFFDDYFCRADPGRNPCTIHLPYKGQSYFTARGSIKWVPPKRTQCSVM
ncbi:hypothetical protein C8R41DRAFT_428016 [Lentinula lateritia]|uniref:Uncharacterized protein n=1 Tax=Lentinula lateritia TaxID=40482 RepID=A0ABQ8W0T4_9AGAR|nr:hypothetical protein C8R41DRAFT_428016 [Lentinula lateritia]